MLQIAGINKSFGGVQAATDVSFVVADQTIVGLIGPNGAGKTSVFNIITGFYPADSGSVRLDGRELTGLPPHQVSRAGIARTFQNIELFQDMTVEENMRAACQGHSRTSLPGALFRLPYVRMHEREQTHMIDEALDFLSLGSRRNDLAGALSYGDQRRLEIARALVTGSRHLLLDEPTAGMTPSEVEGIKEVVRSIRDRGLTVLLIEHNMALVMGISDHVVVLNHGVKIAEGPPNVVQSNAAVLAAYLGDSIAVDA